MAREAILRDNKVNYSKRFTHADGTVGTDIVKGTFAKISADQTVSQSTGTADVFAGFYHADKEGGDGATSITIDKGGVYELVASGTIVIGQKVVTADPGNYVMGATDANVTSSWNIIIGHALEAASAGETINVEVYG